MKRRHIPESHSAHPNVTPLIDIVMCLIIFFMLVAKIGVSTGAEKMDIPESIVGSDINDMDNTLTLNVRPGPLDLPLVTALIKNKNGEFEKTELRLVDPLKRDHNELKDVLTLYHNQNSEFAVIIRGEADMPYRFLEPVLITCANANVRNVDFNTRKPVQATGG
jgi:biopolymer transport protein ExbD